MNIFLDDCPRVLSCDSTYLPVFVILVLQLSGETGEDIDKMLNWFCLFYFSKQDLYVINSRQWSLHVFTIHCSIHCIIGAFSLHEECTRKQNTESNHLGLRDGSRFAVRPHMLLS